MEDNAFHRTSLLDLLGWCQYDTVEAENGREALEKVRDPAKKFDLVLLNTHLPEVDGLEVLTEIKEDEDLREIPVVFVTSCEET